jgi:mannose-6-phosphate isomerase-like protein (cupin superfamily)
MSWRCLATSTVILFALGLGSAARSETPESILEIHSVKDADFQVSKTPHGTANMAPVALPGWMGGGLQRFEKGKYALKDWTYWYHEVMYVTRGRGRITASLPPYTDSESYDVATGDMFVVAPSTRISIDALGDEVFEVFFAVPE